MLPSKQPWRIDNITVTVSAAAPAAKMQCITMIYILHLIEIRVKTEMPSYLELQPNGLLQSVYTIFLMGNHDLLEQSVVEFCKFGSAFPKLGHILTPFVSLNGSLPLERESIHPLAQYLQGIRDMF